MKIVNEAEYREIIKNGYTLVDFFADWCGPCKMLIPVLESLDNEYPDVDFIKVNVDAESNLAREMGIMSIPAVYFFKDGEVKDKFVGYQPAPKIKEFIANNR